MKKIAILILTLAAVACVTACQKPADTTENETEQPTAHVHTPQQVAGCAATCKETGNRAYYVCTGCGLAFKEEDCNTPTTAEAERTAKTGHTDTNEDNVCDVCTSVLLPTLPGGDGSTEMPKVEFP